MQLYEGWTLIELTEDRIVQEKQFGTGKVRMVGNPNPPPEEHEKLMQANKKSNRDKKKRG